MFTVIWTWWDGFASIQSSKSAFHPFVTKSASMPKETVKWLDLEEGWAVSFNSSNTLNRPATLLLHVTVPQQAAMFLWTPQYSKIKSYYQSNKTNKQNNICDFILKYISLVDQQRKHTFEWKGFRTSSRNHSSTPCRSDDRWHESWN